MRVASYKIIVARYNEKISWLNDIIDDCIIINKGTPLNIKNEIPRINLGRESDTYLNYIIDNYDDLPDIVIFTQGRISDHILGNEVDFLLNLKKEAIQNEKSSSRDINNDCIGPTFNIKLNKYSNELADVSFNSVKNIFCLKGNYYFYLKDNYYNNQPVSFYEWYIKNINLEFPKEKMKVYTNGLFAVKKELIVKRTKEYYENLIKTVNHHINPSEGHFLERSWYYIFQ